MATGVFAIEIPLSVVHGTTGIFTVPSDRYAVVRAHVEGGGSLMINGNFVMTSVLNVWNAIARLSGNIWSGSSGEGTQASQNNQGVPATLAVHDGSISAVAGVTQYQPVFTNAIGVNRTTDTYTCKVPAGTTVQGQLGGGSVRYLIELYRIPGSAT